MTLYVVTAPESVRGLYETWEACRAAVSGVSGARFQAVTSRAEAEALLSGDGVRLAPGLYAFVDGTHLGGVGVVLVDQPERGDPAVQELCASVEEVFAGAALPGLDSPTALADALARLRNVLAELAGLYQALRRAPAGRRLTVVHDYAGIEAWMTGRWRARDPAVRTLVEACHQLAAARDLSLSFRHQPAHQGLSAGRHDFAFYNRRADALARQAR